MVTYQTNSGSSTLFSINSDGGNRQTFCLIQTYLDFLTSKQATNSYNQVFGQSFNECVTAAGSAAELFFGLGNDLLDPTKGGDPKILYDIYLIWLTVLAQAVEFKIASEKKTLDWEVQRNLKQRRLDESQNEENRKVEINKSIINCLRAAYIYQEHYSWDLWSNKWCYHQSNCNQEEKKVTFYQLPDSQLINKILELFILCFQNDSSFKEQVKYFPELIELKNSLHHYPFNTGNIIEVFFSLPSINRLGVSGGARLNPQT